MYLFDVPEPLGTGLQGHIRMIHYLDCEMEREKPFLRRPKESRWPVESSSYLSISVTRYSFWPILI